MHGSAVEAPGKLGMEEGVGDFGPELGPGCVLRGAALPGCTTMGLQWDSGKRVLRRREEERLMC